MGNRVTNILVVMTNGDVYYIGELNAKALKDCMRDKYPVFAFTDVKSNSVVTVQVPNVSSIVKEADRG